MTHTLSFYSITEQQVNQVLSELGLEPDKDGNVEADTPFGGKLKANVSFHKQSGQLLVNVLEKPALLTVDTIKSKIREALDKAVPVDSVIVENSQGVADPPPFETPGAFDETHARRGARKKAIGAEQ